MSEAAALTPSSAIVFVAIAVAAGWLAHRRAWFAPAIVVLTAPFAWYHKIGPTEITVSKAAFVGAAIGIIVLMARDPARRARSVAALASNRALLPLAALAVWSAASALWAGTPVEAIRDALKWIWYAGAFALTLAAVDDPADAFRVLVAMMVAAGTVSIDGMWQHLTAAPAGFVAPNGSVVGRIASTLEGPNQFGAYLESAIPPLLAMLLLARLPRWAIAVGGILIGLFVTDLLLTFSRGALWACCAAMLVVAVAYVWLRRRGEAPPLSIPATILACAALVVVPVAFVSIGSPGWQHELMTPTSRETADSTERRVQLWTCAVELFDRHPILGIGAGNFADAKQECGPALAGSEHFNANEWYLETAADLGIVGIALLVAFLIALLRAGGSETVWRSPTALGAYAVLIAFVLHGFVDDVMAYPKAALSFFVLMGLLNTNYRTPPA